MCTSKIRVGLFYTISENIMSISAWVKQELFILHLRFHELALDKSSSTCCYVTKQTSLSSRHKVGPGWLNELGSWIT